MAWVFRNAVGGDAEGLRTQDKTVPLPKNGSWLTAEENGKPVAVMGIVPLDEFRGCMMYMTDEKRPFLFRKMLRFILASDIAQQYARVEALIRDENKAMQRLVKLFGFVDETPDGMKNFYRGDNFHLFVRVR